jgi:hypothetical protein
MKYKLETIPVWEAYEKEGECPLCELVEKLQSHYVDFFLGHSVMVPETRIEVNRIGFCPHHFALLYEGGNKLGLALMTHTHMNELNGKLKKELGALQREATSGRGMTLKKDRRLQQRLSKSSTDYAKQKESCMICDRLNGSLKRYAFTIVHLWQKDGEFRKSFQQSKGFCLPHFHFVNLMAAEVLSRKDLSRWLEELIPIEQEALDRLEVEVHQFTQKFDYRSESIPWGNARDALPRALQKLTGVNFSDG